MQTIIKLYQSFKAIGLPPKAIPVVLFIYCFGTLFESAGIGMLLPIFEMINSSSDQAVTNYSSLSKIIMDTIEKTGVSINLQSLLAISFSLFLLRQIFSYARLVYLPKTKGNFIKRIRDKGFSRYLRTDTGYQDSTYLGRIINDLTTEVDRTGNALIKYMVVGGQVLNASIYIIILIFMSAKITLSALLIIGISVLILRKLFKKVRATSFLISSANQSLSTFLAEKIKSTRLIRLCSNENLETDKIKNQTEVQKNNIINMQIFLARTSVIIEPIFVLSIFVLLFTSKKFFGLSTGETGLFIIIVLRIIPIIKELVESTQGVIALEGSINAVKARLEAMNQATEKRDGKKIFHGIKKSIEFKNVSFTYDKNKRTLRKINVKILPKQVTAIVGPTGSGKSTFVDMLPRLREPDEGRILFDNNLLSSLDITTLRKKVAYAPQNPQIINTTFLEYIAYGNKDKSISSIKRVAKLSGAHEFISKKPEGYRTFVGEDGGKLSGGQKQKVDLARVLLKDASILIFDEPTSHLDLKSRESFLKTLRKLKKKISKTIIIIAHDIQKLAFVDKIIVVKNGQIEKIGSHKSLIQSNNWYSETLRQSK
jgi:subfamily B ATP-binding cassette protein MsbA